MGMTGMHDGHAVPRAQLMPVLYLASGEDVVQRVKERVVVQDGLDFVEVREIGKDDVVH